MRSYAKFQLDQQTRFCGIPEKLMEGLHQPPPVPARVNPSPAGVFGHPLKFLTHLSIQLFRRGCKKKKNNQTQVAQADTSGLTSEKV